jgi:subtilisin family serine protease
MTGKPLFTKHRLDTLMDDRRDDTTPVHLVLAVLVVLVAVACAGAVTAADTRTADIDRAPSDDAEDRTVAVVVTFESDDARDPAVVRAAGGRVTGGSDVDVVPVLFVELPESALPGLRSASDVAAVERDRTVGLAGSVDASASTTAAETGWGYERVDAGAAADAVETGAQSGVDVAVVDTGVDADHAQLQGALEWGVNTTGDETTYGLSTAEDRSGHGTFVTGIVVAVEDGTAPVGVARGVDLYAAKVLESDEGSLSDVVEGIDASLKGPDRTLDTDDDADVISISLGGPSGSDALANVVDSASERAVVVVAAGNLGDDDPDTDEVTYSARYDGAIAVAATDRDDVTPTFSSEGPDVELAAPGTGIVSTTPDGTAYGSGTSFAAPFVAGTAALVIADDAADGSRDLSPDAVRARLQETATDIEADGRDRRSGYGLIQADAAVDGESTATAVGVALDAPANGAVVSGTVEVVAAVDDPDDGQPTVEVSVDGGPWWSMPGDGRYVFNVDTTNLDDGTHRLRVRAREDGAEDVEAVTVTVDNDAPPEVSVLGPGPDDEIAGETEVVVSASDEETAPGELVVGVVLGDGPWQRAEYEPDRGYVVTVDADGAPGNYTLRARATDGSGQTATASQPVEVRDEPPRLTVVEPRANDDVVGRLDVAASVVDDAASAAESTVEYRLAGGEWRSLEYDAARDLFVGDRTVYAVADGDRSVSVRASDGQQTVRANTTVRVDNAALSSARLSVETDDVLVAAGSDATATVSVTGVENSTLAVYLNGVPEAWTVVSRTGERQSANDSGAWVWTADGESGATWTESVTFSVPENATEGTNLTAVAVTDDEAAGTSAVVTVDESASAGDAIVGPDEEVEFGDVVTAIRYYNAGTTVPGTDETLSFGAVVDLIDRYNEQSE